MWCAYRGSCSPINDNMGGAPTSQLLLPGLVCHLIVGGWIPVRIEQNDTVRSNPGNRTDVPRKQFGGGKGKRCKERAGCRWYCSRWGGVPYWRLVRVHSWHPGLAYCTNDKILLAYTKQSYRCRSRVSPSSEGMYTQGCEEGSPQLCVGPGGHCEQHLRCSSSVRPVGTAEDRMSTPIETNQLKILTRLVRTTKNEHTWRAHKHRQAQHLSSRNNLITEASPCPFLISGALPVFYITPARSGTDTCTAHTLTG